MSGTCDMYASSMRRQYTPYWCVAATLMCATVLSFAGEQPGNSKLRSALAHTMAGRGGAAVVLDVQSGHVLAIYHSDVAARRVARPGSSIKPFTLLALLEAGKVDAHTALVCKRPLTIAGHRLDCSHPDTQEAMGPSAALAYS